MKTEISLLLAMLAGVANATVYELLPNGGFEEVKDGKPVQWTQFMRGRSGDRLSVTNDAQRGDWAVALETPAKFTPDTVALYTGTDGGGRGGYPVVPGATYRMKAMVRSTKQAMIRFYLRLGDGGGGFLGGMFSGDFHTWDEWREYSHVFKLSDNPGLRKVGAGVFVYTPNDVVRIDNVSLTFDTSENPGVKDIYRRDPPPTRTLDLSVEGGTLQLDGKAPAPFLEGLHALTVSADGAKPLRIAAKRDALLVRRWRVAPGAHPEAADAAFDDRAWAVAEFSADGTVRPPCAGAYTLRQVILWNANKDSDWKLFLAGTKEYSIPAGAVDSLLAALYSPFDYPLADFAINFELPEGFRFADVLTDPIRVAYNRRALPKSATKEGGVWRFGYGEVKANRTEMTVLPLVAPTNEVLTGTGRGASPFAPAFVSSTNDALGRECGGVGTRRPTKGECFSYWRTAKGNFTELPVAVPIRMLPPIRDNAGSPFVIEGYETGSLPPVSAEHARLHFAQAARVGENRFFLNEAETAPFAKYYEEANPRGLFVHSPSMAFPLELKLWGNIEPCTQELLDLMRTNVAAQVRFRGGAFKPLMKEDLEHKIHYAAWCPSWVNGPGKELFQKTLTDIYSRLRAKNPRLQRGWIDWETSPFRGGQDGSWCWCDACKTRFAKQLGLKSVPTDEEIAEKYVKEWNDFRLGCDAETVRTIQQAEKKAGVGLLVYSADSVSPFYDFKGEVKEVFATVPGNSPAVAYRQNFLEKLTQGICDKAKTHNFIAQRFARLGPSNAGDGWKTMTVCSTDGVWQDDKLWKSQMVRMLVCCQGGVDVQNLMYYPASAQYWMAEGIAAVKPYANLIKGSVPAATNRFTSADIAYPYAVVVEKEGAVLACLYNEKETPKTVTFTLCGKTETVTIPPEDVVLAFRPSSPTTPSERRDWAGPHSGWYTKRAAKRAGETLDLVILGDSINHTWDSDLGLPVWKENFGNLKSENFAMSGDRTEHLLWRITEGKQLDGYTAKQIVVMIGINNSHQCRPGASRPDTPAAAAEGLKAVLKVVREKQPQAKILLLGCFPAHWPGYDRLDWTREYNDIAKTFADDEHIFYHELREVFLKDPKTLDQSYFKDGIHLNERGFRTYAAFLKPLISAAKIRAVPGALEKAQVAVRKELAAHPAEPIIVTLAPGEYKLERPLLFGAEDSGRPNAPVIWRGVAGTVIRGGVDIGPWTDEGNGVVSAAIPKGADGKPLVLDMLFVNGIRAERSVLPKKRDTFKIPGGKKDSWTEVDDQGRKDRIREYTRLGEDTAKILDAIPADELNETQLQVLLDWTQARRSVVGWNRAERIVETVCFDEVRKKHYQWCDRSRIRFENLRAGFTDPGDWLYDAKNGKIRYRLRAGETVASLKASAPARRLSKLLCVKGAHDLRFENIAFELSDSPQARGDDPESHTQTWQSQSAQTSDAAVDLEQCTDVTFEKCRVARSGNYGFRIGTGCRRVTLARCETWDTGAGAVWLGAKEIYPPRDRITRRIIRETYPESCASNVISDCAFRRGGRFNPEGTAIFVTYASDNRVTHNLIDDFYYSGITLGYTWGYRGSPTQRNEVSFNRISRIGQNELHDLAGIYTLATSYGTVISNNFVTEVGGHGIYMDEGSEGILVENNLCTHLDEAGAFMHYGAGCTFRNNIFAYNYGKYGLAWASRRENSNIPSSMHFLGNIFLTEDSPLIGKRTLGVDGVRAHNVWWNPKFREKDDGARRDFDGLTAEAYLATGGSYGDIVADPLFVDPKGGDFRLQPESPAFKLGFREWDHSKAGPRTERAFD